jgi:hypothetical protein
MSSIRFSFLIAALLGALAWPAQAAMYKWVDEKGVTHYGDQVPPRYTDRAGEQLKKSGRTVKAESKPVEQRPSEQDLEKAKLDAKQQLERQRQDMALLATYANENEIEQARERELRRSSDTLKHATAGLAKSSNREDKQKLDALIEQSRRESDTINAKFDAQKARYRELTAGRTTTQTAQSTSAGR